VNGTILEVCAGVECDAATLLDAVTMSVAGDVIDMTNVGATPQPTNVTIPHQLTITTSAPVNLTTELDGGFLCFVTSNLTLQGDFTIDTRMNPPRPT
jgi:hypothetical protein